MSDPIRAERIYRRLLVVLPRSLRDEAEPELLDVFRDAYARAGTRPRDRAVFWLRLIADLAVTSVAERRDRRARVKGADMHLIIGLLADLRTASRRLRMSPAWTVTAAGTLAIGLAAATVTLVLVRDVLLQPLPFPRSDRLVRLLEVSADGRGWWPSFPNAADWRDQARMFDGVGIADVPAVVPVRLDGTAVRVPVSRAARGLFETLDVRPVVGRLFSDAETRPGGPAVAIVSESFWRGALGSTAPGSATISIGGTIYTVVGVLPRTFRFLGPGAAWTDPADIWTPMDRDSNLHGRTSHGYHVVGRLRDGITLEQARVDLNRLATRLKTEHREPTQADSVLMTPLQDVVVRKARDPLRLLLYAAVGVLLVACLNLAAAVLAQALGRSRELSVRLAIGATRASLLRLLVVEAQALALPGGIAGVVLASLALQVIRTSGSGTLPRLDEVRLDGQAVALAFGIALLTATAAGLLPALVLSRRTVVERLRTHGATTAPQHRRVWTGFVMAQTLLTVLLLTGTGLLVRSFVEAMRVDVGYDARHVLAVDIALSEGRYADGARRVAYYEDALARLRAADGIVAAGLTNVLPHVTSMYTAQTARDRSGASALFGGYRIVDPGYFAAIGITVLQGDPRSLAAGGAFIDARLVRQLWNGGPAIGDRVSNGFARDTLTVSGVVQTVREWNQGDETTGAVYEEYHHRPDQLQSMHVVVRYRGSDDAAVRSVRSAFAAVDPMVPVSIAKLDEVAAKSLGDRQLVVRLASGFGAIALLLSAVGVHAMVAFAAARGRREAAIHLALGARPGNVRLRTLRHGLMPAVSGTVVGVALVRPLGVSMRAQLFHVRPFDPAVIGTAALAVLTAALLAAWVPARSAARVDPAAALRQD